jgi:hypothetical protein
VDGFTSLSWKKIFDDVKLLENEEPNEEKFSKRTDSYLLDIHEEILSRETMNETLYSDPVSHLLGELIDLIVFQNGNCSLEKVQSTSQIKDKNKVSKSKSFGSIIEVLFSVIELGVHVRQIPFEREKKFAVAKFGKEQTEISFIMCTSIHSLLENFYELFIKQKRGKLIFIFIMCFGY